MSPRRFEPREIMWSGRWSWKDVRLDPDAEMHAAARFEAGCLEVALRSVAWEEATTAQIEWLAHLGNLYAELGELERSLDVDRMLVRIRPREPVFHYNLACSLSRLDRIDPALGALEESFRLGYDNFDHLRQDGDLDNLRADPRYARLIEEYDPRIRDN